MSQKFYNKDDDNVIDIDIEKLKQKTSKWAPLIVLVVVIAILVVSSIYTLDTKENGVIVRLGKVNTVVTEAGLHFKLPLIDSVRKVDVQKIYNMEYGFRTSQKGTEYSDPVYVDEEQEATVIIDGANNNASIALINLVIQYKVSDPVNFTFKVADVEGTLRLALEDVVRSSIQSFTLDEAKTDKESINAVILPELQRKISSYDTGLEIILVGIQNIQFLPTVEEAYQQKENANQYKNGKIEDGMKYENTVRPQAEAEAYALIEGANAYSATVIAEANADVAQFLAVYEEYKNDPEILRERYYLEAMGEFVTNNKIVIDLSNGGDIYKFYNFDENAVKQSIID